MALSNFSLPYSSGLTSPNWAATISPLQPHHATAVNSLLYGPVGHQESDEPPANISPQEYYKNDPYSPPSTQNHNQYKSKTNNNYLPPPSPSLQSPPSSYLSSSSSVRTPQSLQTSSLLSQRPTPQQQQQSTQRGPQYNQPSGGYLPTIQQPQQKQQTIRTYGEGSYGHPPIKNNIQQTSDYFNGYNAQKRTYQSQQPSNNNDPQTPSATPQPSSLGDYSSNDQGSSLTNNEGYPQRPPGFTRVQAGQGSRTQVHAVLDYDADENDDYYEQENEDNSSTGKSLPTVTPIQGPIFLKNGTVPVVPLFSYPTINNGTFVQIPIWWTALSVALGLDIRGDIIKGVPCVKRYHQLFCPTAGNSYPIDKIEKFIDDNKALMRRMYGDFEMQTTGGGFSTSKKRRRSTDEPDPFDIPGVPDMVSKPDGKELEISDDAEFGETYFGKLRKKRQGGNFRGAGTGRRNGSEGVGAERPSGGPGNRRPNKNDRQNSNDSGTGRFDACESKVEIVTPYWASNSAGKIRAIVNTQHFEQAIHQEICTKVQTGRCNNDCGCEQKYKWHRLLAYDPDNDCKGIFMDWFLFPSCCVCRCSP